MIVSIDRPHLPPVVPFWLSSPLFQCRHHSVHRLSRSCLFFGRSPAAGFSWPLFIGRSGCHPDIGYFWPPLLQSMLFFGKSSFPIFGRRLPAIQPLLRHAIWPSMSIRHCQRSVSPTASESVCDISVVLGNFSGCHSHSLSGRCRYSNRHRSENCSDRIPATPRLLFGHFGRSPAIFVAVSDLPSDFRPSVCFRLCRPCLTAAASAGLVQPSRSTVVSLSDTV